MAPAVVVYYLAHARAALEAAYETGKPVLLLSPEGAGRGLGPGWFAALLAKAHQAVPNAAAEGAIDCADSGGAVLVSLRQPIETIIFTGRSDIAVKLKAIATAQGKQFISARPPALDLLDLDDPGTACRRWLNGL